VLIIAPKKNN